MKDFGIAALIVIACLGIIVGGIALNQTLLRNQRQERVDTYKENVKQDGGTLTIKHGERLLTIEHDGHLFVIHQDGRGSSMIHHPGCECLHTTHSGEAGKDEG